MTYWNGGNSNQSEFGMKKKKSSRLTVLVLPESVLKTPSPLSRFRSSPRPPHGPRGDHPGQQRVYMRRAATAAQPPRELFRRQPSRFQGAVQSPARTFGGHHGGRGRVPSLSAVISALQPWPGPEGTAAPAPELDAPPQANRAPACRIQLRARTRKRQSFSIALKNRGTSYSHYQRIFFMCGVSNYY